MTGWFAEDDLAYGPEIEAVRCGFPSHSDDDCYGSYLVRVLNGIDPAEIADAAYAAYPVWLIGELPDGGWLVQLDVDTVCTAPADAFRDVGPATALWAQFEAEYDRFEQEMQAWAEEADDAWGDEEE